MIDWLSRRVSESETRTLKPQVSQCTRVRDELLCYIYVSVLYCNYILHPYPALSVAAPGFCGTSGFCGTPGRGRFVYYPEYPDTRPPRHGRVAAVCAAPRLVTI